MNKIDPTMCIYHGNCADGFAAAWAVWKKFPNIVFHAGVYGQDAPDVTGHDVVFVDFSYPVAIMAQLLTQAKSITVIDHHKTAAEGIQAMLDAGEIHGVFDMEKSGAMLAWEWFHEGVEPPAVLQHIQDRDLWRFELPHTREIQATLFSYPYDFEIWDRLITDTDLGDMILQGQSIERKHFNDVEKLVTVGKRPMLIGSRLVWCVNIPYTLASDACHLLCKTHLEIGGKKGVLPDFAASYYDRADGQRVFSLRSIGDFDVSEIAKIYGGGGHKNAAGFSVPKGWEGDTKVARTDKSMSELAVMLGCKLDADEATILKAASTHGPLVNALVRFFVRVSKW